MTDALVVQQDERGASRFSSPVSICPVRCRQKWVAYALGNDFGSITRVRRSGRLESRDAGRELRMRWHWERGLNMSSKHCTLFDPPEYGRSPHDGPGTTSIRGLCSRWRPFTTRRNRAGERAADEDVKRAAGVNAVVSKLPPGRAAISTLLVHASTGHHTVTQVFAAIDQLERDVTADPADGTSDFAHWEALCDLIDLYTNVCRGVERRRARARLEQIAAAIVSRRVPPYLPPS